jgi:hypothetical protein
MPKLLYALMCADMIVDKDTNATSFIRTVEHAVVPQLPAVLPPIYFASLWDLGDKGTEGFTVALQLIPPEGKPTTLGIQEIGPTGTMLHKMNFQLPGLNVEAEGRYNIAVAIKRGDSYKKQAELPLFVFKSDNTTN